MTTQTQTEVYRVHHINWGEIPRRDRELVLSSIPIGESVKDMPFKLLEHLPSVIVLKPKRRPTYSVDLWRVDLEFDTMEFQQMMTRDGEFIWERTR